MAILRKSKGPRSESNMIAANARQYIILSAFVRLTMYTADGMKSSIFKPFLIAGAVILTFGFICIWTSQVIQLKEEGEGFAIIGWRFVVGGIVSILIGVISRNSGYIAKNFGYIRYRLGRKSRGHKYDELYKP